MKAYLGVTDSEWASFLSSRPAITEVNFWRPSGGQAFRSLQRGEPFIFKSKWNAGNRLIGGGYFEGFVLLRISEAWDFFGEGNGASSLSEFRRQVLQYRHDDVGTFDDPEIGCIMLNDVRFVPTSDTVDAPEDFSKNIVSGKSYEIGTSASNPVVDLFVKTLAMNIEVDQTESPGVRRIDGSVFGEPRLVRPRLGQGGFKTLVREAYSKRCAITGHKIVPTLQAAHIIPVSERGENRVDNGLLLRSDVHTMFDRGYLGVSPEYKLRVSPRLRSEFGNGDEFYERQGEVISLPQSQSDQPNRDFLEWHMDTVFKAS